jgi:dipeptidyl-peptidase 4
MSHVIHLVAAFLPLLAQIPDKADALKTVAEQSEYRATARYDEVTVWCQAFVKTTTLAHLTELGRSSEGRSIPLLIVADPPIRSAAQAARSDKLIIFAIGNIHAGEVCGKEALPMLLREICSSPHPALLKDVILAVAPIYNTDGNERVSKTNRPGQVGPEEGMGQRVNARGLDLNRDFIKLEAPETQGFVRFLNQWNPHLFIDTHTTNGSYHRYTITYEGPKTPAGDSQVISFMHKTFFPEVTTAFKKRSDLQAFYYGNFNRDHTQWTTYPAEARYGTTYVGLRNRLSVLSEAYAHAPYKTRVLATRDFVRECVETAVKHKAEITKLLGEARQRSARATPSSPGQPAEQVVIRSKARTTGEPVTVLGYIETQENGRRKKTDTTKDYTVQLMNEFEPAASVARPFAYIIPAAFPQAIEAIKRHGLEVQELREDLDLDVEVYKLDKVERSPRRYEGHQFIRLTVTPRREARMLKAGSLIVRTTQPLGNLAVYLLEPGSEDGLATWNFFDEGMKEGTDFPVVRLPQAVPMFVSPAEPLAEDRGPIRPITFNSPGGGMRRGGGGGFFGRQQWVDDEHWLQIRDGRLLKVHAATGRTEPFVDAKALAKSLARIPSLDVDTARSIAGQMSFDMDPNHRGFLFEHAQEIYYASFDLATAVRLTNQPGREQFPKFSPDGKAVAYVRDFDLYAVDIASQTEHRLTTGGRDDLRHGHSDWVYFEEIWNRRWPAFWWSPDSKQIAFMEFDDSGVPFHTVIDDTGNIRREEKTHYPKSGEPNPKVRFGVVTALGGPIEWADLSDYSPDSFLISDAGWWPDSSAAYFYAQNRTQTWLDLIKFSPGRRGGVKRVFRDSTKAWIDSTGPIHWLDDGAFLWLSERDGWKHLYHYSGDGTLKAQLTSGNWEIRALEHVDTKNGWVYFTATRDNPVGINLYRLKLGGSIERLTHSEGSNTASMSPHGGYFVSNWSDIRNPGRTRLFAADGRFVRTLDSNPSHEIKRLRFGPRERVKIPTKDGFILEAELVLPSDLDPRRKHPVWFMTYGGPHAPTVSDSWAGGRMYDQALASEGFIAFRMDPRPASGKGANSAWTAYKHLGVQELEDIKTAINWLKQRSYVDGSRIGMAGHSYGGYITAYAMTHSDLFAAGIAGAPVTDWRDYDSIYTERYMGLPQDNPEGYNVSSVVRAAGRLHGKLLILHGVIDDNVSFRNSMRFVEALQDANKDFEMMVYPSSRHGIFGQHYTRIQLDFIRRTLGEPKPQKSASPGDVATTSIEEDSPRPARGGGRRQTAQGR